MAERARGRHAVGPTEIPPAGWGDILWRVWTKFNEDRVSLVAAGATFYLLLGLFPALAAFVSLYGFVADPVTVADHVAYLGGILPSGGIELIGDQLRRLAEQNDSSLSFGFISGFAIALWSANNGMKALFEAMNIAYEEREKRSFIRLNLITLGITLAAMVLGIVIITGVGIIPALLSIFQLGDVASVLISTMRWPILAALVGFAIALLYRYGPSRQNAQWQWVNWGSAAATTAWLVMSLAFSWYLTNLANYSGTYGSLGALIGFMMWTWLSTVILIMGAELNAEIEHQTSRDSTTPPEQAMGERGAVVADTIGQEWR